MGEGGDGPSCSHPAPLRGNIDWPTGPTCPDALRNSAYSLASPPTSGRCRARATCFANPKAADPCSTLCNVSSSSWGHERFQTIGAATPLGMGKWLRAHVPSTGPTVAPFCFLGYVRTTAEAIRRRAREQYVHLLAELNKCANPEAAHYVERAMLHIFASY